MSTSSTGDQDSVVIWDQPLYLTYGIVMFAILSFGFLGNMLTVIILRKPAHSGKTMTPLMMNLAIASLFIIVLGYPVMISVNLSGKNIWREDSSCKWYAFANGTVGISCIVTLTEMSLVVTYSLRRLNFNVRLSKKQLRWLIAGSWLYGTVAMLPPLLGWTRFVPGAAGISCGPDWTDKSAAGVAYNMVLVVVGFFLPLTVMCSAYFKAYRSLRQNFVPQTRPFQLRRQMYIAKLVRMTVVVVMIFMLSWSPYCFVSIVASLKGSFVFTSEIPDLMAKASVVYHPFVYTVMNDSFRSTLWRVFSRKRCTSVIHVRGVTSRTLNGKFTTRNETETRELSF